MKPIVAELRSRGITVVIYLDDLAILSPSYDKAREEVKTVIRILESLGFLINRAKSNFVPSQFIKYPDEKLNNIVREVSQLYNSKACAIRRLASVIGLIVPPSLR